MILPTVGGGYASQDAFVRSFEALQCFREDEILCDIKLKTDDGKIVNGHKNVLASASPYFRAMFTNFEESSKECVVIQELDSTALRLIVDFIYTAQIIVTEDNVQGLLFAANLLQINDVQDACCNFLQTQMQPANCIGTMALAELYGCTELLSSSESFIQQHFSDVVLGDEFLSLSSEQVIKLISSDELTVSSEEIVFESVIRWVKHSSDGRKDILPKLMENVRLPLISAEFLHERVKEERLVNLSLECQRYVIEALCFHALKLKHPVSSNMTKSIRTKPRKYTGLSKVILVVGICYDPTFSIEWYDPTTKLWQSGTEIDCREFAKFAVLKDRYVFSIGGGDEKRSVDVLDLSSSSASWVSKVPMITGRFCPGVAVLDNCIYAVGGNKSSTRLRSAEVFDCNTEEWRMISSMANRRDMLGVGVLDSLLYAVGGHDGSNALKSVECYDPSTDTWQPVADMCSSRHGAGIGVLNGLLYAVGGYNCEGITLKSVEVYRQNTGTWTLISDMNVPRVFPGVVALDDLLYVVGGQDEDLIELNSVEIYNPSTDTWSMLTASMNIAKSDVGAFVVDKSNF